MRSSIQQWSPNVSPTASSMEAHKPCCVLVVDLSGVRFFQYWAGKMTEMDQTKYRIDMSQWKRKEIGHVVQPGVKKTRGSQREAFKDRVAAQYSHFWKEAARRANQLCVKEGLATIFLVGSDRLTRPLRASLPRELQRRTTIIGKDFGGLSTPALLRRLEQKISEWTALQDTKNKPITIAH